MYKRTNICVNCKIDLRGGKDRSSNLFVFNCYNAWNLSNHAKKKNKVESSLFVNIFSFLHLFLFTPDGLSIIYAIWTRLLTTITLATNRLAQHYRQVLSFISRQVIVIFCWIILIVSWKKIKSKVKKKYAWVVKDQRKVIARYNERFADMYYPSSQIVSLV